MTTAQRTAPAPLVRYYAASTNGFYSNKTNGTNIPADAVVITDAQYTALLAASAGSVFIQPGANGQPTTAAPVSTTAETIEVYETVAQAALDALAQSWGYDSLLSASSYVASTNAQFKAEAAALVAWRDATWTAAYAIEAAVQAGTQTLPATPAAFVALLPAAPARPTTT